MLLHRKVTCNYRIFLMNSIQHRSHHLIVILVAFKPCFLLSSTLFLTSHIGQPCVLVDCTCVCGGCIYMGCVCGGCIYMGCVGDVSIWDVWGMYLYGMCVWGM